LGKGGDDDTFLVFITLPGGIWCKPGHGRIEFYALLNAMTTQSEPEPRVSLNLLNLVMATAGAPKRNKSPERTHKPQAAVLYHTLEVHTESALTADRARQVEASLSSEAPIVSGG